MDPIITTTAIAAGAVAAGKGGVAIRGDVHGSVIITSDNNEVNKDKKEDA